MAKSREIALALWRGPARDGRGQIVLWAIPRGGNKATGPCVDLYVAAESFILAQDDGAHVSHPGAVTRGVCDRVTADSEHAAGCPLTCPHLWDGSCYALHSAQNASQTRAAMRALLHSGGGKIPAADLDSGIRLAAAMGIASGRRALRACVSGDIAQVPEPVALAVFSGFAAAGISRRYAYTHDPKGAPWLRGLCMASADSDAAERAHKRAGWSVFRVVPKDASDGPGQRCHKDANDGGTCGGCPTPCDGTADVWIPEHGPRRMPQTSIERKAQRRRRAKQIAARA